MKLLKLTSLLTAGFLATGVAFAADAPAKTEGEKPAAADASSKSDAKAKPIPYQGTVASVDKDKQSFVLKEKKGDLTLILTDKTKILNKVTKQPAKIDDIVVDAYVTGSYDKKGEVLEAHSVHLGGTAPVKGAKKAAAKPADAPAAPATTDPEKK